MKITLASAWVSTGYDNSEGILDIEEVGLQSIHMKLPQEIIAQIEAFYVAEYHRRMKKVMDAA